MRRPKNETTRHPPCLCPVCFKMVDAASPARKNATYRAKPGDLSICLYCGSRLVFTRTMQLRLLTEREWMKLEPDHRKYIERLQLAREQVAARTEDFPQGHVPSKVQ